MLTTRMIDRSKPLYSFFSLFLFFNIYRLYIRLDRCCISTHIYQLSSLYISLFCMLYIYIYTDYCCNTVILLAVSAKTAAAAETTSSPLAALRRRVAVHSVNQPAKFDFRVVDRRALFSAAKKKTLSESRHRDKTLPNIIVCINTLIFKK